MTLDNGVRIIIHLNTGENLKAEAWGSDATGLNVTTVVERKRLFIPWINIAAVEERL